MCVNKNNYLEILYERNCDFFKFFLDYRHKFMVRYLLVVAAALASPKWLHDMPIILTGVCVLCAIVSGLFFLVERRTTIVLIGAHKVGDMIEETMAEHFKRNEDKPKGKESKQQSTTGKEKMIQGWPNKHSPIKLINEENTAWNVHDATEKQLGFFTALTRCFSATPSHSKILQKTYLWGVIIWIVFAVLSIYYGDELADCFGQIT